MTFIATRRRFGRYVFAIGGNPDAAELGGINVRWTIMQTYVLMGVLVAISRGGPDRTTERRRHQPGRSERAGRDLGGGHRRQLVLRWHRHDSRARCWARWSCSRCARAWSCCSVDSPTQDIVVGIVLVAAVGWIRTCGGVASRSLHELPTTRRWSRCAISACRSAACTRSTTSPSTCSAGEVVGLVGGNGAGKSTLMRALSGAHPPIRARSCIDGQAGRHRQSARRQGARHRDDLSDAGAGRQHRRAGQHVSRSRAA